MLTGLPALAQVSASPPGEPAQQQGPPAAAAEPTPNTGLPSPTGQIGLPSSIGQIGLPSPIGLPPSPGGAAASPESPFGLSPDIFPGILGGRPDRQEQQPAAEPGISTTPAGAQPETAAPIAPQPGLAATPQPAPPPFLTPGFGFGNLPGYGFGNFPGYGFGNLTPGGALLPPNPVVPSAAGQNPLATARLAPVTPGALPVQAYDSRAPAILIHPRISASLGYTDNPRSAPGTFSDGLARVRGDTAISVDTVRLQGQLTGGIDYQRYARATDQDRFNANFLAYGLGTVVRDHVFIDGRAGITEASTTGGVGFAAPSVIPKSNLTQVVTTSLTPIARESFGGYVDGELRYNNSLALFQQGGLFGNSTTTPALTNLNNAMQNRGTLSLATGRLFTTFGSKLTLDATKVDSQSAARTTQLRAIDNLAYKFNEKFAGIALLGYENLDYPLQPDASFTGPAWAVGGQYSPFGNSYLLATYGRQEGLLGFAGSLRYEITPRTIALASYSRNRASQQQQIINNLNSSAAGAYGTLVDQTTGLSTALVNPQLALTTAVSKYDTGRVGLQTQLDRDTLSLFGFYQRRTPLGTPIGTAALTAITAESTSLGANLTWGRSLTPRLNSLAALGYAVQSASDQKTLTASLTMTYVLSERLTATLLYQFIDVDTTVAGGSYRRNQVEIGLTRSF